MTSQARINFNLSSVMVKNSLNKFEVMIVLRIVGLRSQGHELMEHIENVWVGIRREQQSFHRGWIFLYLLVML